jgi:hypothetical protein
MGRHTKRGGYFIEWEKVRSFVVPDLTDFKVRTDQLAFRIRLDYMQYEPLGQPQEINRTEHLN